MQSAGNHPVGPLATTRGATESRRWLAARGLDASKTPDWHVEIDIPSDKPDARIQINIYPQEWGFVFRYGLRVSSIRITDELFVHGADDHHLAAKTQDLDRIGELMGVIEAQSEIVFQRNHATVRSNLARAFTVVRTWASSLQAT